MLVRNEEKTELLLNGLGEEVSVENIDEYLKQQGVLVDVHVGRLRNKIKLDPKMLGVDIDKTEDLSVLFKDYVKTGELTFIPMKYEKKLQSIETSIRDKRKVLSLGYDNKYMPVDIYISEFKPYLEKKCEDYMAVRDEIIEMWDDLIINFKKTVTASFKEMNALNEADLVQRVMKKIPDKDFYSNSFYVGKSLKAFPVMGNLDLLNDSLEDEVRESIKNDTINSLYEIISNILSDAFNTINHILSAYQSKGTLSKVQIRTLAVLKSRIQKKNILKHSLVNEMIRDLDEISCLICADEIAERCEFVLANIYGFAKEIEIEVVLDLDKCLMDEDELLVLYNSLNEVAV